MVEWLVKPGDWVKRGDVVAVVETQKGAIEIEIFQAGQVEQILVNLHSKVAVGTPLARIRAEGGGALGTPAAAPSTPLSVPPLVAPPSLPLVAPRAASGVRASPAARRLAEERGIHLSTVTGSGPAGAIIYADVERVGETGAPPEKKRALWLDLDAMRTAIATAMARSKREIPHYYLRHQVDVTACEQWLSQKNATLPPDRRLLIAALAIKAVALAARRFPAFNGFYRDNKYEPAPTVHVGVAIAIRGGGLAAPALHDADQLSVDDLMSRMRDLVQRTRVRAYPQFRDLRSDHNGVEPRGTRCRNLIRYHLSAAGSDCRVRQDGGATVGHRWRHRSTTSGRHYAVWRPSSERWTCRRAVPGRDRQAFARAGEVMSYIDIRKVLQEELNNIAPEVDIAGIDPAANLREVMDIDSMDFLNFITAIHHRLGIDIPEIDYPKLVTLDGAVAYLGTKLELSKT